MFRMIFRRAAAALVAAALLIGLAGPSRADDAPTEDYLDARTKLDLLTIDADKGRFRDHWIKLAERFDALCRDNPDWKYRAAAMYRAAKTYEELHRRSFREADAVEAVRRYTAVAKTFPHNVLADDALFAAARIQAECLHDDRAAGATLTRLVDDFPNGDMAPMARIELEELNLRIASRPAATKQADGPAAKAEAGPGPKAEPAAKKAPSVTKQTGKPTPPAPVISPSVTFKQVLKPIITAATVPLPPCFLQPSPTPSKRTAKDASPSATSRMPSTTVRASAMPAKPAVPPAAATTPRKIAKATDDAKGDTTPTAIRPSPTPSKRTAKDASPSATSRMPSTTVRASAMPAKPAVPPAAATTPRKIAKATDDAKGDTTPAAIRPSPTPSKRTAKDASPSATSPTPSTTVRASATPAKPAVPPAAATTSPKASARPDHAATLIALSCTADDTSARLVLDTDNPVQWSVRSFRDDPKTGAKPSIVAEFPATAADRIVPSDEPYGGMLETLTVSRTKTGTLQVVLVFRTLVRFAVVPGNTPETVVIEATSQAEGLPDGRSPGESVRSARKPSDAKPALSGDIAAQLGLSAGSVVIDAGHGGKDPGALGHDIVEKNITMDMAKRVSARLRRLGFTVRTTRERDIHVPLAERARIANRAKGDIFVSIHVNANLDPEVSGVETYYLNFACTDSAARVAAAENAVDGRSLGSMEEMVADIMLDTRAQESKKLGYAVQTAIMTSLRDRIKGPAVGDNGVRSAPMAVLMGAGMPGVLVEIGYCSNPKEAKRLLRQDYRNALAEGIAKGVLQYASSLSREPQPAAR